MQREPLVSKYRPRTIKDLVLPNRHNLHLVFQWLANPYPSAWLLYGPSGIGKTSLANIMATIASPSEHARQIYVGPDLDSNCVRQMAPALFHKPVWGGLHGIVVNEADSIPTQGQVRLLSLLEANNTAVIVATSNQDLSQYESRWASRFQCIRFTKEGLLQPATAWLSGIADLEHIPITPKAVERLIVESKSNLREALQRLDAHAARILVPGPLPVMPPLGEPPQNRSRIVAESSS